MMALPLVTVLIPARNEASDIEACLAAVAAQEYPVNRLEVIVVDGASSDGTADVARRTLAQWGFASTAVLTNEGATTPSNLNAGLARASGSILCRVDARTRIERHYVRTCVEVLAERPDVAVVGGAQVAVPRDATVSAQAIARALNNGLSMGGSPYRRAIVSGPSDTVYLGAFRVSDLRSVGGWDERLPTNQDFDLNRRISERGLVWFEVSLRSSYLPRRSLRELWQQYERFGRSKVRYWRLLGVGPNRRQWVLLGAPPIALAVMALLTLTRPRAGLVVGGLALASLDHLGSRESGSLRVRATAIVAMLVITVGWWGGVAREMSHVD